MIDCGYTALPELGDWLYIVDDKDLIFPVVISDYIKQCKDAELIDEVLYEMYDVLMELG